eukprot:COSAG05_NODE_1049_length_6033_cov_7.763566_6_plen_59_part_00
MAVEASRETLRYCTAIQHAANLRYIGIIGSGIAKASDATQGRRGTDPWVRMLSTPGTH